AEGIDPSTGACQNLCRATTSAEYSTAAKKISPNSPERIDRRALCARIRAKISSKDKMAPDKNQIHRACVPSNRIDLRSSKAKSRIATAPKAREKKYGVSRIEAV